MKSILLLAVIASVPAHALDEACAAFVNATEKTNAQASRHQVSSYGDAGQRLEGVIKDGRMFMQVNGRWMQGPPDFVATERQQAADLRSGKIKLSACRKLGRETVDGIATTVYSVQMQMPDMPVPSGAPAKVYIGDDGLVYAQAGEGYKVRYRYTDVVAPKL